MKKVWNILFQMSIILLCGWNIYDNLKKVYDDDFEKIRIWKN